MVARQTVLESNEHASSISGLVLVFGKLKTVKNISWLGKNPSQGSWLTVFFAKSVARGV